MKSGIVSIKDNVFEAFIAISDEEQQQGLMYLKDPPAMIFPYKVARINKFWMKNCPAALDIIFCKNGKVSQIHYGEPFSTKMIGDNEFSDLIIELPYGTANQIDLKAGDNVELISPKIDELKKIVRY